MKETYEVLKMEVISFDAEILTIDAGVTMASSDIDQGQTPYPAPTQTT